MAEKSKVATLAAGPKTFLGTSNFGNTNVNGTLNVTGKLTIQQEGTIGAESKDAVTGKQIHNLKTELESSIASAGSNATAAGAEQLVNGQWKVTVEDGCLVIKYGNKLLASWDAPVE